MSAPTTVPTLLDPITLRRIYASFPTGVVGVAASVDGTPVGMAVSSFIAASQAPPLVCLAVAEDSQTWRLLRRANLIGISVLGGDQRDLSRQLSLRGVDRSRA